MQMNTTFLNLKKYQKNHTFLTRLGSYSPVSPRDAAELRALEDRAEAEVRQYRYDLWHEMDADVVRETVTRDEITVPSVGRERWVVRAHV